MKPEENYLAINRATWNQKTEVHIQSDFYAVDAFLNGKNTLNGIELDLLGDVRGKRILHLQCHFGQDSISLARLGAQVTGIDLSDRAIEQATAYAQQLAVDATFICCDVYSLPQHLDAEFDIVFTSYGTIGWLPDLQRWAAVVSRFLKPGGRFIMAEFHPLVWMFNDQFDAIIYRYFNDSAIVETETGTYADKAAQMVSQSVTWNHALSEVITSLLHEKLHLVALQEFDYSPYNCFNCMKEDAPGKFRIAHLGNRIPMVYALVAEKPVAITNRAIN
jgi:2-polyprenyl-3-methyl-5-hydroxy-6-metoxy-1,4-benzoquinol methylase